MMKKSLLLFVMLVSIAQFSTAQKRLIEAFGMRRDDSTWWNKGDKFVGLQTNLATLGTDFIINAEYFFEQNLSLNARVGFVSFKPTVRQSTYGHRAGMVTGDVNYYASLKKRYAIYVGLGLSYIRFGNRVHSSNDKTLEPYNFGPSINLNLGAHYKLYKNITLFAEVGRRYSAGNLSIGANIKLR